MVEKIVNKKKFAEIKKKIEQEVSAEKEIEAYQNTTSNFMNAVFTKHADFRNAFFFGDVNFKDAEFRETGRFKNCLFFNAEALGLVDENSEDSVVDLNMDGAYFNLLRGVEFKQIFPHLNKRMHFGKVIDGEERKDIIDDASKIYIYLQENFKKIGLFEDADKIYLERKRMEAEREIRWWEFGWKRAWSSILDLSCEYGTNFRRIVIWSILIILVCTVLYFLTIIPWVRNHVGEIGSQAHVEGTKPEGNIKWPRRLWHAFYLSVTTFTTLGMGDVIASRYYRILVIFEGGLGWFMLCLFIVVLARQYFR